MKDFFEKFEGLKGASYIGIREYLNQHGEVANISLLANVDVMNAKKNDLAKLKALTDDQLVAFMVSKQTVILFSVFKTALAEMIVSGEKNVSADSDEHTTASKAQADAYVHLCPSVKMHKDSMTVFVTGFANGKTVLIKGVYKEVNSRDKTIAKDMISELVQLRMKDYRQYNLGNMNQIRVDGAVLQVVKV